jgi:Domain of unknown function DUF29
MAQRPGIRYHTDMPDDLYDRDALAWSEHQASLLRRVTRGERVNEVDWEHVIEEIEDVGLSQLHAVESYLELIFVHLLKIRTWPDSDAVNPWRAEFISFQSNALRRFAPSMRQRLDSATAYRSAVRQVTLLNGGEPGLVAGGVPVNHRGTAERGLCGAGAAARGGTSRVCGRLNPPGMQPRPSA